MAIDLGRVARRGSTLAFFRLALLGVEIAQTQVGLPGIRSTRVVISLEKKFHAAQARADRQIRPQGRGHYDPAAVSR